MESEPETKIVLSGDILVSDRVNPDQDGRPSPVTVRIYQLASVDNFKSTDFLPLYDDDETALGTDLVFKEEMEVYPGIEIPFQREWAGSTRYLGVMVMFRDLENSKWRAIASLPEEGSFPVVVRIDDSSVSIWEETGI